jgi:hypothetical protein
MGFGPPARRAISEIDGSAFEVLCLKLQISSTKLQINHKIQYSMTKTFQDEILFGFWNFGHWKLFDICNLIFGISINQ